MAYTKKQNEFSVEYKKKNIKRVPLDMQIEDYEKIKIAAGLSGESVNGFIKKACASRIESMNIGG